MPRYVILLHEMNAGDPRATHWDLMLEREGVLRTWALPCEPKPALACEAEALADHRLRYLEYQGPISGDRGSVARWDEGTYRLERETDEEWIVRLDGRRLCGHLRLARIGGGSHSWRVSVSAAPTRG